VKTDGDDGNDGSTWDLAKQTVSAAITAASSGDEIWVKAGTYNELITLKDGIGLCGGFTGYETEREERNWATAMSPTKLLVN
jgi:pectin methylesterase-like acyl-CoA thioesterase